MSDEPKMINVVDVRVKRERESAATYSILQEIETIEYRGYEFVVGDGHLRLTGMTADGYHTVEVYPPGTWLHVGSRKEEA